MLINYLPGYYKKSKVFSELLKSFLYEINANNYAIYDLENQLFIDTSTWGLEIWEKEWGIYTDLSKPYEQRREAIKAKMRGSGTCTIEMIKNTALAYTNAEIEVIEHNANYSFVIKFVGVKGIPPDMKAFGHTIDTIKPAHLSYVFEYTYMTWDEAKKYTWDQVKTTTWDDFRTGKVI